MYVIVIISIKSHVTCINPLTAYTSECPEDWIDINIYVTSVTDLNFQKVTFTGRITEISWMKAPKWIECLTLNATPLLYSGLVQFMTLHRGSDAMPPNPTQEYIFKMGGLLAFICTCITLNHMITIYTSVSWWVILESSLFDYISVPTSTHLPS